MNWSSLSPEAREQALQALMPRFDSVQAAEREAALRALIGLRGDAPIRLAIRLGGDPEPSVRTLAQDVRRTLQNDTEWFGSGESLRMDIPPRLLSPEEEEQATRRMWMLWTVGGVMTVSTLFIREHLGMTLAPLFGSFVITLALLYWTRKLRQDPPSPGWVFFDLTKQEVLLEQIQGEQLDRTSHPFSAVKGLNLRRATRQLYPDEPPEVHHQLELELHNGMRQLLARTEALVTAQAMRQRLQEYTGLPLGPVV